MGSCPNAHFGYGLKVNTMKNVFVCILVLSACGGEDNEDIICTSQQAIRNAEGESDVDTVALVYSDIGQCSGTLIGSRTILTAAHCLRESESSRVFLGGTKYAAFRHIIHPLWVHNPDRASINDLALIILEDVVTNIEPAVLSRRKVEVDDEILLVGYGRTDRSCRDGAVQRRGTTTVNRVTDEYFHLGDAETSSICSGDSGGPSFDSCGEVVGVHWSGPKDNCRSGGDIPVLPYVEWIEDNLH